MYYPNCKFNNKIGIIDCFHRFQSTPGRTGFARLEICSIFAPDFKVIT